MDVGKNGRVKKNLRGNIFAAKKTSGGQRSLTYREETRVPIAATIIRTALRHNSSNTYPLREYQNEARKKLWVASFPR